MPPTRQTISDSPRIFISFEYSDAKIAKRIGNRLRAKKLSIFYDGFGFGSDSWLPLEHVKRNIKAGDYVLMLLGGGRVYSEKSQVMAEKEFAAEAHTRAITILPIVVAESHIPHWWHKNRIFADISKDTKLGIEKLVNALSHVPALTFARIGEKSGMQFETLVMDLLKAQGYKTTPVHSAKDSGYDIVATSESGTQWLVQVKKYGAERVDFPDVVRFSSLLGNRNDSNGLIVTTGQLNSVTRNRLARAHEASKPLVVIEGTELRRQLLSYPELISRHFDESEK